MASLVIAYILDALFGDPKNIPHPICAIGTLISSLESALRPRIKNERSAGSFLVVIVCIVCFFVPLAVLMLAWMIHPFLALVLNTFWSFQIIAATSLCKESMKVFDALSKGDLELARVQVSYIVGRETGSLSEQGVVKAAVETVAENTTDGVIAPLLYLAIGGAPLGFLYKGINTMDSMIGYKNERYILFGRSAAKLDDAANYLPARISALCMLVAARLCNLDARGALDVYRRDRTNHASPNAAQTESVCAGALGVQLAGNATYFGTEYEKPTIGNDTRPITAQDISRSCKLMKGTSLVALFVILVVLFLFYLAP